MSKEEKEAIETLKTISEFGGDNLLCREHRKKIDVVLNIIEKQQKEIDKIKKENKILKDVFEQIRDLTTHYIVWYDYNSENYNLRGCSKQEIYKNFGRIREIVYAHYCNMNNDKALKSLIIDKLKEEQ